MSGDGQQEEAFDDVSAVGGVAEAGGRSARQVPSQAGPGRSSGDAEGGTVLPGPWPAPADPDPGPEADVAVPMQREGGRTGLTDASGAAPSDADLIRQMRDGDDLAYEELFRRHSDAVRRYARSCCRDAHTADDLTAEVFARTLQAVRRGKGPEEAVRAYLMTAVRHVGAAWTKTAKREHLVDDFAVFAAQASQASQVSDADTLDLGADVLAMHEAEQSMAMQAFRSLPERWQAVLWHTTVEEESPSEIAPLFGLTANATAVLASRAREGLKQAYLQAHVSQALTAGGDCARYADRLGAYARGGLRMRAERGLRGHLEECSKCRLAAGELAHVNAGIPALLPVAVIGWFAAGYTLKAAGIVAGGAAGAAGAGAAAAATGEAPAGVRPVVPRPRRGSVPRRRPASRRRSWWPPRPGWSGHWSATTSRSPRPGPRRSRPSWLPRRRPRRPRRSRSRSRRRRSPLPLPRPRLRHRPRLRSRSPGRRRPRSPRPSRSPPRRSRSRRRRPPGRRPRLRRPRSRRPRRRPRRASIRSAS